MTKQELARFITLAVGITVSFGILLRLFSDFESYIALVAVALGAVIAYKYPRTGLWTLLIYLPFSGSVIYSLGYGHIFFHLLKDAFYFPALIALIQVQQNLNHFFKIIKPLIIALAFLLAVCVVTLLVVHLPQQLKAQSPEFPVLMWIFGFKVLIGYIPLTLCAYYLIRNQRDLFFLTRLQVIVALLCSSLCLIQYILLITGICDGSSNIAAYLDEPTLDARCFVGGSLLYSSQWGQGLIRLPGTFVAPWQWAWFLISSSFFTYASAISDPSHRWRIVSWVAMASILLMSIISGQRVALVLNPIIFLILSLLTIKPKGWLLIKLGIIFLGILMASNLQLAQDRWENLVSRWQASPPDEFIVKQFYWAMNSQDGVLGNGLGTATNAARIFGETRFIETYYAKLLYEMGPLGILAFLAVVSTLTLLSFKALRSVQEQNLRRLGICLWTFVLVISYNTFYYPLDVDPVAIYYWFFAGVLLKLPELEVN
ncbi:MAG: hypothetical protein F6K58_16315 [Symploca sp. SIO2E9]|nr:hypothetical protein [Symploca sp. SIO2E9]